MVSNKPNVLIVHNYYQIPGGEDTVVKNEMKMLEEHGHNVLLYSRHNDELRQLSIFGKLLLPFRTIFSLRTYREVKKLIREKDIDIVHVHNTLNLVSPSVYYAALHCHVPVVQTVHNFRLLCPAATFYRDGHICEDCVQHGLKCAVKHNCYRNSKLQTLAIVISMKFHRMTGIYGKMNYICLTEFNKEKLLLLKQIKPESVFVKPNFVDYKGAIVPFNKREKQFVFAGRLDKLKGVDLLMNAWQLMGSNAPKLIVCGTGPLENWCRQFVTDNQLTSVELRGFVSNREVQQLMGESISVILPTQWYEGFPMSVVESFSRGTPVIGSDIGNVGSLIDDDICGFQFKHDSADMLVNAVKKVLDKMMVDSTYLFYRNHFAQEINYKILFHIYYQSRF